MSEEKKMQKKLLKSKTFWTGIGAVVAAIGGYTTGTMGLDIAIQTGLGGLLAIFLRDGMEKK